MISNRHIMDINSMMSRKNTEDSEGIKIARKYSLNTPSWESILSNYAHSYSNPAIRTKWSNPAGFFVDEFVNGIPEVSIVLDYLGLNVAHGYFSIYKGAKTFGRHTDTMDVWFWQARGETTWEFDNSSIKLSPGDLLYVPRGVAHEVFTITDIRAGISMSYEPPSFMDQNASIFEKNS